MTDTPVVQYAQVLRDLKHKIQIARQQAAISVNSQILSVYWEIGKTILNRQQNEGWGAKVIDRLSADLKMEFKDMQGLSVRNMKYMRAFAESWPSFPFVQAHLAAAQDPVRANWTEEGGGGS